MALVSNEENYYNEDNFIDIFESINWEKIPLGKIFEFIIKFPKFISQKQIENLIISAIYQKTSNKLNIIQASSRGSSKESDLKLTI